MSKARKSTDGAGVTTHFCTLSGCVNAPPPVEPSADDYINTLVCGKALDDPDMGDPVRITSSDTDRGMNTGNKRWGDYFQSSSPSQGLFYNSAMRINRVEENELTRKIATYHKMVSYSPFGTEDILDEVVGTEGMTAQSKHVAFGDSMPGVEQAVAEASR